MLSLLPIDERGLPVGFAGPLCQEVAGAAAATAEHYGRVGFRPPWIGYLAESEGVAVGTCAFKGAPAGGRVEIAYFTFPPHEGRGHARGVRLFVNGRPVQDRVLFRALTEGFRGVLEPGRYPLAL